MPSIFYSDLAIADFKSLYVDLEAQAGAVTTIKYRDMFRAVIQRLGAFPESGAPRPKLGEDMRIAVVDPYLVIYRFDPESNGVQIHRIVHGKRNITRRLLKNVSF